MRAVTFRPVRRNFSRNGVWWKTLHHWLFQELQHRLTLPGAYLCACKSSIFLNSERFCISCVAFLTLLQAVTPKASDVMVDTGTPTVTFNFARVVRTTCRTICRFLHGCVYTVSPVFASACIPVCRHIYPRTVPTGLPIYISICIPNVANCPKNALCCNDKISFRKS